MELIHDRLLNNQFAPGIATYGIDGKDGKPGPAGTSFYFTSYSLEDKQQADQCIVKINRNMVLSEFVDKKLDREYAIGDLVLDAVGRIYKIVQKNGQFALDYVSNVVGLDTSSMFKTSDNNRLYLDSVSYSGLDLIQGTEDNSLTLDTTAGDAVLRIANTKEDTKTGKFNILQMLTKPAIGESKYLNLTFDKSSETFILETNSDLLIDSSLIEVKSSNSRSTTSLGDYYKITPYGDYYNIAPYSDPIGLVHLMLSGASWKLSGSELIISNIDITHLTSLGLSPSFTVKVDFETSSIVRSVEVSPDENNCVGSLHLEIEGIEGNEDHVLVSVIRGIEVFIPPFPKEI